MPAPAVRRGALLLPLSLALCGDSLNLGGGCGRGHEERVRTPLTCTLEASGAMTGPFACQGTWTHYASGGGGQWDLSLQSVTTSPGAPPWVDFSVWFSGPGVPGVPYGTELNGTMRAVTAGALGYSIGDLAGPAPGTVAMVFTSMAPLAGTVDLTLVPGQVVSAPLQTPTFAYPPGPAGTAVTVHATFREP